MDLLIVDDNEAFADALALRLRLEPVIGAVEAVYSAEDARQCLGRHRPDVVLLDYHLVGGPSLPLLTTIEQLPDPPAVLVLSGSQDVSDIVLAVDAGADGWVSKSLPLPDLLTAVDQALAGDLVLPPHAVGPVVRHLLTELHRKSTSA
ncbi:MAG TPA: response regulator [Nocardioidaceae bacterium]|nr:response regulator [Nocardioidaceae bacterium]